MVGIFNKIIKYLFFVSIFLCFSLLVFAEGNEIPALVDSATKGDTIAEDADATSDTVVDGVEIKAPIKKKLIQSTMKFRGSVTLGGYYYFGTNLVVVNGDIPHFSNNSYTPYDYTQSGDSTNRHHNDGIGSVVGSTWGGLEGKLFVSYSVIAPFLTADNPLVSGNNIKVTLDGELTPVTINQAISVTITPIAFLELQGGAMIGTGWNFFGVFNGMGLNDGTCAKGKSQPFYSACFQSWFKLTFQFDVAALMPAKYKRWTHIQMQASPKLKYKALLNTESTQPFQYEADRGEDLAGWRLEGQFVLGYKIPIIIEDTGSNQMFLKRRHNNFAIMAAMMFVIDRMELTHFDMSTMESGGFGSDFCYVYFGPTLLFDLPNNMNAVFGIQWANDKEYTSETVGNIFYQDRLYKDWYLYFARIMIAVGWNF